MLEYPFLDFTQGYRGNTFVPGETNGIKPEFTFSLWGRHMNVGWLISFI